MTHRYEDRWTIEVRIPYAGEMQGVVDKMTGVVGRPPSETYPWFFNIDRQRVRADETTLSVWSASPTKKLHDRLKFGTLIGR